MTETFYEQQSQLSSLDIYLFIKMSKKKEHPDIYVQSAQKQESSIVKLNLF